MKKVVSVKFHFFHATFTQCLCQLPVDGPVQAEQDGEGDDRHED